MGRLTFGDDGFITFGGWLACGLIVPAPDMGRGCLVCLCLGGLRPRVVRAVSGVPGGAEPEHARGSDACVAVAFD